MTRDDILKALGYSDARIEAIERSGHQLAIDIPQEVVRLADALADDGLIYDTAHSPSFGSTNPDAAGLSMRVYRSAVIERVKGSE